jgi:glucose 1-dehydrogenase
MKAIAIVAGTAGTRTVERAEPSVSEPDDVKVRIIRVRICGTDSEELSGGRAQAPEGQKELVIDHEMFGQVVSTGSSVTRGRLCCLHCQAGVWRMPSLSHGPVRHVPDGAISRTRHQGTDGFQTEYVVDKEQYIVRITAALESVGVLMEPFYRRESD